MPQTSSPSVLVTGSSTGIGEACVMELDRRGCRVFAGVRRDADAERLRRQASDRLIPLMLDVTDADQIAAAAGEVGRAVGETGLQGLVNNAGIVIPGPLELLPLDLVRRQLEVNVVGQIAVTNAMMSYVRAARGRIVNMGSISGRLTAPLLGAYSASKYALEAVNDALRIELRQWGIRVSIVEPGSVKTPIWDKSRAFAEKFPEQAPSEKLGLYATDMQTMRQASEQMARTGIPAQRVVRAVMHALFARRPRTRYPVDLSTRLSLDAFRFVPDRVRDWFILRSLGMR